MHPTAALIVKLSAGLGLATAVSGVLGCEGQIIDPPGRPSLVPEGSFACDPNARPGALDLQRLPAVHYRNTLSDLFAGFTAIDVKTVAAAALANLPEDGMAGLPYKRMDGRLSLRHVETFFDVADAIAQAFEQNADARRELIGDCANEATITPECVDLFLDQFAWRAFRRPLEDDERQRFHSINDGTHPGPELVRGLVFATLMSPQFVYRVEVDGKAIEGDTRFSLDAYALASRLSYHFWRTMPDQQLFDRAADGSLLTEDGYRAEVDRIFEDPRTQDSIETFFREWLVYDQVGGFPETAVFNAFANDGLSNADRSELLQAMHAEVDGLVRHVTWEAGGDFRDLLLTDVSVTTSSRLASLYGVAPWNGGGAPPRFTSGTRSGLLTRAAFLVTGSHVTNPVLRGAIVRRRLLCQDLEPPDPTQLPPGALDTPEFKTDMTTRQRYEEKTRNEPCASCHTQLNPIGFVLERYDALGRERTHEKVLDSATGQTLAELLIDTTTVPELSPGDTAPISEPAELSQRIADTGLVEGCFARNYFRYTYGREETSSDDCALQKIKTELAGSGEKGSLRDALRAIALDPSFRQRVVGTQNQE